MNYNHKEEKELLTGPGDVLLETLEYLAMSQVELAERMGKKPSKINDLISGKEPITIQTALQLEKVFGIEASFWLNRELLFREKLARIEEAENMETCLEWLNILPLKELKLLGYVSTTKKDFKTVSECLSFYGVATPIQWGELYVENYSTALFRKSKIHETTLGAISAWLRLGEIEKQKVELPEYNKELFKEVLNSILLIVREHPEDFATQVKDHCFKAGVAVVYTTSINKAPVSGVTRWIGKNPLIQLTDRFKTNDHFWFTFFHEAGHILLHGKKEIFIENYEGFSNDTKKEEEANLFSSNLLLPSKFLTELQDPISLNEIKRIARIANTHPAIVLARLQFLGLIDYHFHPEIKQSVHLIFDNNKN